MASLQSIEKDLKDRRIFHSNDEIISLPSAIGYEKKFRLSWMATQLNTFVVVSDAGGQSVSTGMIEEHLTEAFKYAKKHYKGWPRGLQSGLGVISILIGDEVDADAQEYCLKLKSGKKWAGFSIPVTISRASGQVYFFKSKPMWGRIYYPYFEKMIKGLCKG